METADSSQSDAQPEVEALQFKGSMLTLTTLDILSSDMDALSQQLQVRIAQAPDFFAEAPVLLNLDELPAAQHAELLADIVELCRSQQLNLLALRSDLAEAVQAARVCNLAVLSPSITRDRSMPPQSRPVEPAKPALQPPKLVTSPVRSGQQVYAKNADLIVTAAVSAGAELLADGNIHVYGALRGRALAGINGNTEARIFCHQLGAELVSIAGQYKVAEDLRRLPLWGHAGQISLQDEHMLIQALG